MALDLSNTDLAGQLRGCRSITLQRKGTVQWLLVTAPHTSERDLLYKKHIPETKKRVLGGKGWEGKREMKTEAVT